MRRLTTLALLLAWLAGCTPANRDELAKQVLQVDPEFSEVLEKHRTLSNDIEESYRRLILKRTAIEQSIAQLRKDLAVAAANVRAKITEVKKHMEPDRRRLEDALSIASKELQKTRSQRASLGRQIMQLRKALKSTQSAWTPQERSQREAKIDEMLQDAKRLDQEMAVLKEHARLLKIKLLLIKL